MTQLFPQSECTLRILSQNPVLFHVTTAAAGGGPVADGGGVRPCSDAEEAGVSKQ